MPDPLLMVTAMGIAGAASAVVTVDLRLALARGSAHPG